MTERHAVPFSLTIRAGGNEPQQVADALNHYIAQWEKDGWRYVRLESITTFRNNGCIASLFGNPMSVVTFQVAILERG